MLSAIIAAVAARQKIRKSPLENEAKARCLGKRGRGGLVSEFNCLRCLVGVDVDAELFPHVVKLLDLYLKTYRPILTPKESNWMFPGIADRPKSRERLRKPSCARARTRAAQRCLLQGRDATSKAVFRRAEPQQRMLEKGKKADRWNAGKRYFRGQACETSGRGADERIAPGIIPSLGGADLADFGAT